MLVATIEIWPGGHEEGKYRLGKITASDSRAFAAAITGAQSTPSYSIMFTASRRTSKAAPAPYLRPTLSGAWPARRSAISSFIDV